LENKISNSSITKEVVINAPKDLVWHAWTISDRVSQWFAPVTVIEPKVGGAFELYFDPGNEEGMNTKGCKVKSIVPNKELVFTWKGPDQFASIMNSDNDLTIVNVYLEEQDDKTIVKVLHKGWKDGEEWDEAVKWHEMAWQGVLSSLKNEIEKGEGILCCQPE
jgi:uncharacterized protein YndB with AHSA1/START domain